MIFFFFLIAIPQTWKVEGWKMCLQVINTVIPNMTWRQHYTYTWNTGSNTAQIHIHFSLFLKDNTFLC